MQALRHVGQRALAFVGECAQCGDVAFQRGNALGFPQDFSRVGVDGAPQRNGFCAQFFIADGRHIKLLRQPQVNIARHGQLCRVKLEVGFGKAGALIGPRALALALVPGPVLVLATTALANPARIAHIAHLLGQGLSGRHRLRHRSNCP